MDLHRLAYAPRTFDAVYNNNVMEHLYNGVDDCFAEVREILRPRGTFVFVMPTETNPTNPDAGWQLAHVGRAHDWWLVDPGHPWKSDLHDIQARLLAAGFEPPRFAYFEPNLAHCVARARARRASTGWVWLERLCRMVGGSLMIQRVEAWLRASTGFYGYLGVRRWLRYRLPLPNRQTDTLQIAVIARRS
jgi:SAM-dependent methyltransferase